MKEYLVSFRFWGFWNEGFVQTLMYHEDCEITYRLIEEFEKIFLDSTKYKNCMVLGVTKLEGDMNERD